MISYARKTILGALLAAVVLCAAGVTAQVSVGDEVHHYRFAKDDFLVKGRATFDAIYGGAWTPGYFYNTEFLWPLGISFVWRAMGYISFPAAQVYQSLFYFFLLWLSYVYFSRRYDPVTGAWSTAVLGTVPMVVSFGMLFYLDVPAMALMMGVMCLLEREKITAAGLLLAAAILTKKSMLFFCPAFLFFLLSEKEIAWPRKFLRMLLLFVPAFAGMVLDATWRNTHLVLGKVPEKVSFLEGFNAMQKEMHTQVSERLGLLFRTVPAESPASSLPYPASSAKEYAVSNLFNYVDLFKYFGVALIILLVLYFVFRCFEKKDRYLWALCLSYLAGVYLLRLLPDVRYLLPVTPFLALFAAKSVLKFSKERTRLLILLLCLAQFAAVGFYTRQYRSVAAEIREGFAFIKENTPEKSVLLYPETNIMEFTDRAMVWSLSPLPVIFWGSPYEKAKAIDYIGIDYIVVKKTRTYDDLKASHRHLGAYPQTFLEALPQLSFLRKVWENSQISVWKVTLEEQLNASRS